jgi:hypothetical protein
MELNGEIVTGVPYYGEPMRGGVRVYHDDKLATVIKRRLLDDPKIVEKAADGPGRWKLFAFLEAQGIDTKRIAEAWIIRGERRAEKLPREELAGVTFEAGAQGKGEIQIGKNALSANALALHSKPLRPDQLPQILPGEEGLLLEDHDE